jgi:hypothetical protein
LVDCGIDLVTLFPDKQTVRQILKRIRSMSPQKSEPSRDVRQLQQALSRWDNEGGATETDLPPDAIPQLTNTELVALRVRMIALENIIIALLASASNEQLELVGEMAEFISPRSGFTQHRFTMHAASHMTDLVKRSARFRSA